MIHSNNTASPARTSRWFLALSLCIAPAALHAQGPSLALAPVRVAKAPNRILLVFEGSRGFRINNQVIAAGDLERVLKEIYQLRPEKVLLVLPRPGRDSDLETVHSIAARIDLNVFAFWDASGDT